MNTNLVKQIEGLAEKLYEKVVGYREYLHQHPELSYQEEETMNYIASCLDVLKIPHQKEVAGTGVVGMIRGKNHLKNAPCIGLRADIDALPILEENSTSYCSKNEGVMHACGHDAHTSILLGVAEILNEIKDELPYPVKLIFQPGEEKNPGGASLMIKAGVLKNPTVMKMYALHCDPDFSVGITGTKQGLYMASCDEIYMTIKGKGGHGARPHETVDTILIGAEIVTSLQKIVSRKCDPKIPCVLTFGHFEAIGATNIIPEKVHLKGTFRTMNEEWRATALDTIKYQAEHIAIANGSNIDVTISKGYPFLENDPELTDDFIKKAEIVLGKENVYSDLPIRMGAEDFSYYAQEIPTLYFRLGVKNEKKGIVYGLHNSKFDIDPEALKVGMKLMAVCTLE